MKTWVGILCVASLLLALSGCHGGPGKAANLLSVDFKQDQTLRYKLISDRQTLLNFDPGHKIGKGGDATQKMSEHLEMTVAYKPISINPDGLTTLAATFEKVNVTRSSGAGAGTSGKDAVTYLEGKTVKFTLTPTGMITDFTELNAILAELVKQAFGGKAEENGVKDPEMIMDFVALQWFMWDAVSSIEHPARGVDVGQKWTSKTMAPLPWPSRTVRDTTYTLAAVDQTPTGRTAVVNSRYVLGKNAPREWPMPYKGMFRMRSTFGFLTNYNVLALDGNDVMHYSINDGKLLDHTQTYTVKTTASMPFALGSGDTTPQPTIDFTQKLSAELLP